MVDSPGAYPKRKSVEGIEERTDQEAGNRAEKHRERRKEELDYKETNYWGTPREESTAMDSVVAQHGNKVDRNNVPAFGESVNEQFDMEVVAERLKGMQVSDPMVDP